MMRKIVLTIVALLVGVLAFDYLLPAQAARLGMAAELMRCGLTIRHLEIAGFDISYAEGGARDGEPLILVHGFGAAKDNFIRTAPYLNDSYHLVIPDLPGFGDSSKPASAHYGIADQVARLHEFINRLGLKKVHLGGSSMGGFIIAQYALTYPDEVASLWLLDPAGVKKAMDSELTVLTQKSGYNPLISRTPEDFDFTIDFATSQSPWMPYSVRHMMALRAVANHDLHERIFKELVASPLLDDQLDRIKVPTLLVWGKEDRVLNPAAVATFQQAMPQVEVILMDGIGHLPMLEVPAQAAKDYLAFRESLAAR